MPFSENNGLLLEFSFTSVAASDLTLAQRFRLAQQVWCANSRLGMTGYLHFAGREIRQIIEGPSCALLRIIPSILADPRHEAITITSLQQITRRAYSDWRTSGIGQLMGVDQPNNDHGLPRIPPATGGRRIAMRK